MRSRLSKFAVALGLLLAGTALANPGFVMRELEDAYEEAGLRITMYDEANGRVLVSKCATCPIVTLKIIPETQLFVEDAPLPLTRIREFRGRPATVFRVVDTDIVSRIKIQ